MNMLLNTNKFFATCLLAVALATALVGCGGSSSSTEAGTATVQAVGTGNLKVPLQIAFENIIRNGFSPLGRSFTISGWMNSSTASNSVPNTPITGTGTLITATGQPQTFQSGTLAGTTFVPLFEVFSGSLSGGGTSYNLSSQLSIYANPNTYTTLETYDGTNTVVYSAYSNPVSGQVGNSGTLGSGTDSTLTTTTTYSVTADGTSISTLLLTTLNKTWISGVQTNQVQTVYRVDTAGNVSIVSMTTQEYTQGVVNKSLVYTFN